LSRRSLGGTTALANTNKTNMTKSTKSKLIKQNIICWLAAILLPVILHVGLSGTKFPWPIILPLLLFPAMLASNSLLSKAAGDASDDSTPK
jgi:hypothetical protein